MPGLSRQGPRLLRTVGNKSHATQEDHVDQLPTPASTRSSGSVSRMMDDEDVQRDPESSSEDERPISSQPSSSATFKTPQTIGVPLEARRRADFKQPSSAPETEETRISVGSDGSNNEDDSFVFENEISRARQRSNKRKHIDSGVPSMFAPVSAPKRQVGYGRKSTYGLPSYGYGKRPSFKPPRSQAAAAKDVTPARPEFKVARGVGDMFEFGSTTTPATFQAARGADDPKDLDSDRDISSTSSLSPERSFEDDEIEELDLPEAKPYVQQCPICTEEVDALLKESFENQFTKGRPILDYKWQQRFCRWHKAQDAMRIWTEKGYPEINWERLERRMQEHHRHLKDVVSQQKPSHYRDGLSEKVKERSKTAMHILNADEVKAGASVGYYGPRGERLMTEHIINHLSDKLREQASKDKLVAAVGVSGGVSGFVSAVMVPELAEQLIMEDMRVPSHEARAIAVESAELGELLYPEVDD